MHSRDHQVSHGTVGIRKISKLRAGEQANWGVMVFQFNRTVWAHSAGSQACIGSVHVWVFCVSVHTFESHPACIKLQENPAHWPEQPLLWETSDWVWQGKQQYVGGKCHQSGLHTHKLLHFLQEVYRKLYSIGITRLILNIFIQKHRYISTLNCSFTCHCCLYFNFRADDGTQTWVRGQRRKAFIRFFIP